MTDMEKLDKLAKLHKEYIALRKEVTQIDGDDCALRHIYIYSRQFKSLFNKADCDARYDPTLECVIIQKFHEGVLFQTFEHHYYEDCWFPELFPNTDLTEE